MTGSSATPLRVIVSVEIDSVTRAVFVLLINSTIFSPHSISRPSVCVAVWVQNRDNVPCQALRNVVDSRIVFGVVQQVVDQMLAPCMRHPLSSMNSTVHENCVFTTRSSRGLDSHELQVSVLVALSKTTDAYSIAELTLDIFHPIINLVQIMVNIVIIA